MKIRRVLGPLLVLGLVVVAVFMLVLRPRRVVAHMLSRGAVLVEAFGTGSVESRRTIDLGFEVTGRVVRLEVDQGDAVEQGQLLASIDDETFQAEVTLAADEVTLAETALARLESEIERAQAVLEGADSNLTRVRPLVDSGVVSEEELDVAQERHKVALAELARARAALSEGRQGLVTAQRKLERAKAALARTVVMAPVDGLVLQRERELGDVAMSGAPVLRLAATDTVWASVWVDETYLGGLSEGLPARIVLRSETDRELAGRVARIGREVDRETRELLVDVAFEKVPERLVFGQRVDVWIELERATDVHRVPVAVLARLEGRDGVFVAEGRRARFRALELGRRGREFAEFAHELPADTILLSPTASDGKRLEDGQRVTWETSEGRAQ